MKMRFIVILFLCIFLLTPFVIRAKEYKVSVKELPGISDYFVSVIKAVIEATGNTANIQVVPPARAEYLLEAKEVEIQYPIIAMPDINKHKDLKYDYSTVVLMKVAFVLYTNKNKPIDFDSLNKGNPNKYKIEVDPSRINDFDYTVLPSNNFDASVQKVANGTIDGLIVSQTIGDPVLKKMGFKNIKRQLWYEYEEHFSIQKGARGGEVDKMLTDGVTKLRKSGEFAKLTGGFEKDSKYNNWQP